MDSRVRSKEGSLLLVPAGRSREPSVGRIKVEGSFAEATQRVNGDFGQGPQEQNEEKKALQERKKAELLLKEQLFGKHAVTFS